jgi:uncharacterized protein DUF397
VNVFPTDEHRAIWRKSSRSGASSGNCVEVAGGPPGLVAVRDSKSPHGPRLSYSPAQWRAFLDRVRTGEYDL